MRKATPRFIVCALTAGFWLGVGCLIASLAACGGGGTEDDGCTSQLVYELPKPGAAGPAQAHILTSCPTSGERITPTPVVCAASACL